MAAVVASGSPSWIQELPLAKTHAALQRDSIIERTIKPVTPHILTEMTAGSGDKYNRKRPNQKKQLQRNDALQKSNGSRS
jgi:hypothetical protein